MVFSPDKDGIDHINIYSKGQTELGRWLSNFAYSPFTHPLDGKFASIEGYWYWLLAPPSNPNRESLRKLVGYAAKSSGRKIAGRDWNNSLDFQNQIKYAIILKLNNYPDMKELFLKSTLPLTHYYNFGGKIIEPQEAKWIVEFLEDMRKTEEK